MVLYQLADGDRSLSAGEGGNSSIDLSDFDLSPNRKLLLLNQPLVFRTLSFPLSFTFPLGGSDTKVDNDEI